MDIKFIHITGYNNTLNKPDQNLKAEHLGLIFDSGISSTPDTVA
jgi:hypothetical protein